MDSQAFYIAFTTFFATVGPVDLAAVFASLTTGMAAKQQFRTALRGVLIAGLVLLIFALFGNSILNSLGISAAAMRISAGILLLFIGLDMVYARSTGGTSTAQDEQQEAESKSDIAIFPLALPLIAGPGAIGATILLMSDARGDFAAQGIVLAALLSVMLLTLLCLAMANPLQRLLGVTGMHVVTRVMGILLCALAVQFVLDGLRESDLFSDNFSDSAAGHASATQAVIDSSKPPTDV